jgi:phage terminase large subunit-like protein
MMTYDEWNNLRYEDFVNDPTLFKACGVKFDNYNFNLKDEYQDARWVHQYCYEALTKYKDETCLNIKLAQRVIDFYRHLSHVKGTSSAFKLLPWQQFVVGSMFGWVEKTPSVTGRILRRFRYSTVFVARKNGKSTLACGIALYMLLMDGEPGADVFTTGPTGKQARIVFDDSRKMLKASILPQVFDLRMNNDAIYCDAVNAKMEYKNSIPDNLDGLNSHCCILDEVHSFKSPDVYNVMKTSMGGRETPMFFVISTAGTNLGCIGHDIFQTREKELRNGISPSECEREFSALYCMDNGDAFNDIKTWHKANPSLRSGARKLDEIEALASEAAIRINARPNFLTKYLNFFVQGSDKWLQQDDIKCTANNTIKLDDYRGSNTKCYIGVDIGLVDDLSAIGYVFTHDDGTVTTFAKAFFPSDMLDEATTDNRSKYIRWANMKDGTFNLTDGATCDFELLEDELVDACRAFNVQSIELDPWNANQLARELEKRKLPANLRGQGKKDLNEPTKLFERLIKDRDLEHDGSGVLEWCMYNSYIEVDKNNLVSVAKVDKHSADKIDCVKAIITALAGYVHEEIKAESRWKKGRTRTIRL